MGAGQNIPGQNIPCHFNPILGKTSTQICHPGQDVICHFCHPGRNIPCALPPWKRYHMGYFVQGGKSVWDVFMGVMFSSAYSF